jgi:adenosylhomocysteine nucleosidase
VSIGPGVSGTIVAVTGLAVEARIASGPGVRALAGGGNARQLALALERELARGAKGVISFGVAGGLAEDIVSGTWLVARAIVTSTMRWPCDAAWARMLGERLRGALTMDLTGTDAPVTESAAKRALYRTTGAAAVDTESHIAAAIAARHGVPFAAFRVVVDAAQRDLPAAARLALEPDGRISGAAVLRSLARTTAPFPSLVRTTIYVRTAFRALSRGRRLLGPGLGYPDLGELLLDVS